MKLNLLLICKLSQSKTHLPFISVILPPVKLSLILNINTLFYFLTSAFNMLDITKQVDDNLSRHSLNLTKHHSVHLLFLLSLVHM